MALQISLKEEIELARSRSAFRDDSIVQEEEAMAQLLESRREYSDLRRRDDLVRSDLLHANAEILALRKEITAGAKQAPADTHVGPGRSRVYKNIDTGRGS